MAKLKFLFISFIGFSFFANAQDSTKPESPKPTISGSLDVYYRFNFANSKTSQNNPTAFTNSQNSFELGMASIRQIIALARPVLQLTWVLEEGPRNSLILTIVPIPSSPWPM